MRQAHIGGVGLSRARSRLHVEGREEERREVFVLLAKLFECDGAGHVLVDVLEDLHHLVVERLAVDVFDELDDLRNIEESRAVAVEEIERVLAQPLPREGAVVEDRGDEFDEVQLARAVRVHQRERPLVEICLLEREVVEELEHRDEARVVDVDLREHLEQRFDVADAQLELLLQRAQLVEKLGLVAHVKVLRLERVEEPTHRRLAWLAATVDPSARAHSARPHRAARLEKTPRSSPVLLCFFASGGCTCPTTTILREPRG